MNSFLKERVLTSECDKILLVNCDINIPGKIYTLDSISEKCEMAVSESIFNVSYSPAEIFNQIASHLESGSYYFMSEIITGADDAFINVLVTDCDSEHVRFYRTSEFINAADATMDLIEFKTVPVSITLDCTEDIFKKNTANVCDIILDKVKPEFEDSKISCVLSKGYFVWRKR